MWLIPWSGSRGLVQARIRARGRQNRLAAAADGLRGDPGFVDVWCKCSAFSLGTKQTEEFQKDPEVVLAAIRGPKGHWDAISAGSPEVQGSRRQLVGLASTGIGDQLQALRRADTRSGSTSKSHEQLRKRVVGLFMTSRRTSFRHHFCSLSSAKRQAQMLLMQAGLRKDKQFALNCVRLDWRNLDT